MIDVLKFVLLCSIAIGVGVVSADITHDREKAGKKIPSRMLMTTMTTIFVFIASMLYLAFGQ